MYSSNSLYSSFFRDYRTSLSAKKLSRYRSIVRIVAKQFDTSACKGCITSVQNGIGTIRILNFKPHAVTLKRNLLVVSIFFPDNVSSITPFKNNDDQEAQNKFTHAEKPSVKVL